MLLQDMDIMLLAEISQYLTVQELAACCAASRGLRTAFNEDLLWRPHCTETIIESLSNSPCIVDPIFVSPEPEGSSLDPICHFRLAFMRENHLWNNWRKGNCKKDVLLATRNNPTKYKSAKFMFFANDYIMVILERIIELWNVKDDPFICISKVFNFTLNDISIKCSDENYMVVIYKSAVLIIEVNLSLGVFEPLHVFAFNQLMKINANENDVLEIFAAKKAALRDHHEDRLTKSFVVGHSFVGVSNDQKMHIWDIRNGTKLKEDVLPIKKGQKIFKIEIKYSETTTKNILVVIVLGYVTFNMPVEIFVYSLEHLKYLQFKQSTHLQFCHGVGNLSEYQIYAQFCLIYRDNDLHVYNYTTSKLIAQKPYFDFFNPCTLVVNDNFVFINESELFCFDQISCKFISEATNLETILTLSNRFVAVSGVSSIMPMIRAFSEGPVGPDENPHVFIYEVNKSLKKTALKFSSSDSKFLINKISTKMMLQSNGIVVIRFW